MAFTPEQRREYRRKLKERGICTVCGTRESGGRAVCKVCRDRSSKYIKERRSSGRCHNCFCKCDEYRCPECRMKHNEYRRKTYKNNVLNGKCTDCGVDMCGEPYATCVNCQQKRQENKEIARSFMV